jgi:type VI secretion system protein ImpL
VLGAATEPSSDEVQAIIQRVNALYAADYIGAWDGLLGALEISYSNQPAIVLDQLNLMAGNSSPLAALLQAVHDNTALRNPAAGVQAAAAAVQPAKASSPASAPEPSTWPGTPITAHFAALNALTTAAASERPMVDTLVAGIGGLYGLLAGVQAAGDPSAAALQVAAQRAATASPARLAVVRNLATAGSNFVGDDPISALRQLASALPQPVRRWLGELADTAWSALLLGAADGANVAYVAQVAPACDATIAARYPLQRDATAEITVQDFGQFFKPGGTLDGFFRSTLAPFVDTRGSTWSLLRIDGQTLPIDPGSLSLFQRAATLRSVFFRGEQSMPSFDFTLEPVTMDPGLLEFSLQFGSTRLVYRHDPPQPQRITWPGSDGAETVRIAFVTTQRHVAASTTEGPWAWFRMMSAQKVEAASSSNHVRVTFSLEGLSAVYDVSASSAINPFQPHTMPQIQCPPQL